MIRALTGETIKVGVYVNIPTPITVPPTPPTPADLTQAVAKLAFKNLATGSEVLKKDALIVGNYVSGRLEGSETLIPGKYICEIRLWIDGEGTEDDADGILREVIYLTDSVLKEQEEGV